MVGWHHRLNGHEFEQTLGDSEGQESLVCFSPWNRRNSHMTEPLNNNKELGIVVFVTPWTAAHQASLSITNSRNLLRIMSIESVMPSNHLICQPLLLLSSIFPSIRVFSTESALCTRWPKYWSSSFNISPSSEYSGLISIKIDWFDVLATQGTIKSLLQHCSLKASFLWCSVFFMVQLSHPCMTIGKKNEQNFDRKEG